MDFIFGKNSVYETLCASPQRINKILFDKTARPDAKLQSIKEAALNNKIAFQFCPKEKFESNYQGVIAYVSPIEYADVDTFIEENKEGQYRSLVILDGVKDPHNLGAIIRTCVCAGVDGIIIPNHKNVLVNATVEKTACGATNLIPIFKVNSLQATIERLKNNDWWIIATSSCAKDNYYEIDYSHMNYALILGAEGEGVSKTLLKQSDFQVKIPSRFESLNVSNASAVIIYEALRQRLQNNI